MGVETCDEGSKKLFNRAFQNEEEITKACSRLINTGVKVKFEIIVGLPNIDGLVPDPVEDAIHSVKLCQRIASKFPKGSIKAACNALVLYPGTKLWDLAKDRGISIREDGWKHALYEGVGSVIFPKDVERRISNIVKMTVMFVKYGINEKWMRALIDMDMTDEARRKLSEAQYIDSLTFRLGSKLNERAGEIISNMSFKY